MKRNSLTLLTFLSVVSIASLWNPHCARAQFSISNSTHPSTLIGFRAGISIATESFSEFPGGASSGLKFGLAGGVDIEHWFNDKLGISTGLYLLQKGVDEQYAPSTNERSVDTNGNDNFSMNYFEVPVLVKLAFGYGDIHPFVFAGPSFGFLASASESTDGTITPIDNLKSYINNTEISIYFGGGVMENIERGPTVMFDAGYETGLTKVFSSEPLRPFAQPINLATATSSEIIVTFGLLWPL